MFVRPSRPITVAQAARVLTQHKRSKQRERIRAKCEEMAARMGRPAINWSNPHV